VLPPTLPEIVPGAGHHHVVATYSGPRLSAALILKNEAQRLPACLESIRTVVDEIVVVDTGSTDATVEIATAHGARVFHHPWQHDFSLHRNQSLDYATGDWVLVIDGDEVLEPGNLRALLALVHADPEVDGLAVRVDGVNEAGVVEQIEAIRVFRRERGRYRYPVHNQLEGIRVCAASTAVVTAYYVGTQAEKAARSLPMLLAMAEHEETRSHAAFFIAKTLRVLQRFAELRVWTAECRQRVPAEPGYATFWLWDIESALVLEGMDAAEAALAEALRHHPDFSELYRYRTAFSLFRWQEKAGRSSTYRLVSVVADGLAVHIPVAAQLLGLPLEFRVPDGARGALPVGGESGESGEKVREGLDKGGGAYVYPESRLTRARGRAPLGVGRGHGRVGRVLRSGSGSVAGWSRGAGRGVAGRRAGQGHQCDHPGVGD
jgi:glycosyltransferase involved in cell wall biosynthesis